MNCKEIRESLLFYLDGEASEAERVQIEAHLASCPDCAAELARLRALQADLREAIPVGLAQLRLSRPAEARIRARLRQERARRSWWASLTSLLRPQLAWVRVAVPALMLMCLLAVTLLGPLTAPVAAQETLVVVPATLTPATDAALRVIVRRAGTAQGVADAEIGVRLRLAGQGEAIALYTGRTDAQGTAKISFRVPDLAGDSQPADLIVTTTSSLGRGEIRQPVTLKRSFRLYLTTDKPLYRPGQSLHMRALALQALGGLSAQGREVTFAVESPDGKPVFSQQVRTSDYGIAAADWTLPAGAPYGAYRLTAGLGDTVSQRTVTVGRYDRPQFKVELSAARPYYLPGEVVEGSAIVRRLNGDPLPGVQITLHAYLRDPQPRLVATVSSRADEQGAAAFRFGLPASLATPAKRATLALEAVATDGAGHVEWAGRVVPVADEPLAVDVVPEGGRLRPGVENLLYILTAAPDGAPVQAQVEIEAGDQRYGVSTDAYGLAQVRFVPLAQDVQVRLAARAADGRQVVKTVPLSADRGPAQVLLRLDRAAYEVGETMRVEALAGQGETVYLDVMRQGQTLGTHLLPLHEGKAELSLDVSPEMAGTLELHAYQVLADGTLARDARFAVVDAPTQVVVSLHTDQTAYTAGETAQVAIGTTLDGRPVQSALGIAVVDESVFALEERAPGFAKLFFLLQDALLDAAARPQGVTLPDLLDPSAVAGVRAAQDVAARAAWAGLPTGELAIVRGTSQSRRAFPWFDWRLWLLGAALVGLLVLVGTVVARQLRSGGLLRSVAGAVGLWAALSMLVVGPTLWLTGCAQTVIVEEEKTQVVKETIVVEKEVTKVVEKEVEKEITKVVQKEKIVTATPTPQPTPTAAAAVATATRPLATPQPRPTRPPAGPTATPPSPPPLLGQFVPETILWLPEAVTDPDGHLELDVPLPDVPTTWRLTVLASTQQGQLGAATALLHAGP